MTNKKDKQQKTCFVICPIGSLNTKEREQSDKVLKYILSPVVLECGYGFPVRADNISEPGIITTQVIELLIEADLVIADLSGSNANVFYELAIRHMIKKPIVHIIRVNETLPFDVNQCRTLTYDSTDVESVHNFKSSLEKQIKCVESDPLKVDNPICRTIDFNSLKNSNNVQERQMAQIICALQTMEHKITHFEREQDHSKLIDRLIDELQNKYEFIPKSSLASTLGLASAVYPSTSSPMQATSLADFYPKIEMGGLAKGLNNIPSSGITLDVANGISNYLNSLNSSQKEQSKKSSPKNK